MLPLIPIAAGLGGSLAIKNNFFPNANNPRDPEAPDYRVNQGGRTAESMAREKAGRTTSTQGLVDKVYGTSPQDYGSVFKTAYGNLGQDPERAANPAVISGGTQALAQAFVDRFHNATGQLPTEDQIRQFVGQNLTSGFAQKFIQGIPQDQINAVADMHIQSNPQIQQTIQDQRDQTAQNAQEKAMRDYTSRLQNFADQQFNTGANLLARDVQDQYVGQKRGLVEDIAARGALGNANSSYDLNALEASKNREMERGLAGLAGQRAMTGVGLGATGANLGLESQRIGNQASQFGQQLGLANREFQNTQDIQGQNLGIMNRQLGLASDIGKRQAEAQKPGWLDYLNAGANAGRTLLEGYAAFKGGKGLATA